MSTSRKHTHTGHCQICGRIQAVDNLTKLLAKHGYKVAGFGFFNGVCSGSGEQPLQLQHVITDDIVIRLTNYAANNLDAAAKLKSGEIKPIQVLVGNDRKVVNGRMTYIDRFSLWSEASVYHQEAQVKRDIFGHQMNATNAEQHVKFLIELKSRIYGTALIPVKRTEVIDVVKGLKFVDSRERKYEVTGYCSNPRYMRCRNDEGREFNISKTSIRNYVKAERNKAESVT